MQGKVVIGTELDTKSFDKEIAYLEAKLNDIEATLSMASEDKTLFSTSEIKEMEVEAEKLKNKLIGLYKKQTNKIDFSSVKTSLNGVSNSITGIIGKLGKMALAVFGIRSAFMFVRSAINTIAGDDEQLKADIDYMKSAIAYTIEPIVRGIVNLAKQLMFYVGYVIKALTGKNIFANANKGLKDSTSSAKALNKELNKTVASFDEMNVLQSPSSGGGDTGVGKVAPSFDLTGIENQTVPKWLDKVVEFGKWVLKHWEEVVFTLLLVKLFIDLLTGNWIGVVIDLIGLLIIAFKKIWENIKIIIDILKPYFKQFVDWIVQNIITPIGNFFGGLWNGLVNGARFAINGIKNAFSSITSFFSGIVNTIYGFFRNVGATVGNVISNAFKSVVNAVLKKIESTLNVPIRTINNLTSTINKYTPFKMGKLATFSLPRLARGGIVSNPGNGVFMGNYIAGERGTEAVIPLNDETMERLGLAIGRHTSINATIPVYAYNRQVAREIRRIEANQSFATNGR